MRIWCAYEVPHGCTTSRGARPHPAGRPSVSERQLCLGVPGSGLSLCSPLLSTFQLVGPCRARIWAVSNRFLDAAVRPRLSALPAFGVLSGRSVRYIGKCCSLGNWYEGGESSCPHGHADPVQPAAPFRTRPPTNSTSTTDRLVTLFVQLYHD
jgi:hypothetical protein